MLDRQGRVVPTKGGHRICVKCDKDFLSWDMKNNHRCCHCLKLAHDGQVIEGVDDVTGAYEDREYDVKRRKRLKELRIKT